MRQTRQPLRRAHPLHKAEWCDLFWRSHGCRHGLTCKYAHSIDEYNGERDKWVEHYIKTGQAFETSLDILADAGPGNAEPQQPPPCADPQDVDTTPDITGASSTGPADQLIADDGADVPDDFTKTPAQWLTVGLLEKVTQ